MKRFLKFVKLSPTMTEGEIVEWKVNEGQPYKNGDLLFTVQTDKSVVEFNALDDGILRKILKGAHSVCKVGDPIGVVTDEANEDFSDLLKEWEKLEAPKPQSAPQTTPLQPANAAQTPVATSVGFVEPEFAIATPLETIPTLAGGKEVLATPYAKQLAKEQGRDLKGLPGSGYQGIVTAKDVEKAPSKAYQKLKSKTFPEEKPGSYSLIPMSPMRKAIAKRLQQSKQFIPHFYVTHVVNTLELGKIRQQLKDYGIDCTINDFILRAVALSLRDHPEVNSGFDSKTQSIIRFHTVDVSVAVSIPEGLITPIVRLADFKGIEELSKEVKFLVKKAKEGTLKPEEYQGGSFTLSNLGMFGIDSFMPIINPPQAAILGVGGSIEGQMKLTLAADHRFVDGADAARFLATLKKFLESPTLLLL
ncbi:MAG: 2-oxo acid dehydrogenase subunit E2 [Chlamydiae bacterium]|nr:2-oxo acid dehydrogenase subunit E2 [Chlamydiota bacterium]